MSGRKLLLLPLVLVWSLLGFARPAHAACDWVETTETVNGIIRVVVIMVCDDDGAASGPAVDTVPAAESFAAGTAACIAAASSLDEQAVEFCNGSSAEVITAGLVARAFSDLQLPPSELVVQPPDGRTLVNFATNFSTETESFTRTITLLGQRVDLRITPASYGWRFGDGGSATTTTPGAAYPDLQVTHDYLVAGAVSPAVDTTYTADFRVNVGAWAPVPGTVTIPGASVPLEVVEATPTLVGYR